MNEWSRWEVQKQLEVAAKALEANGFTVSLCDDRESAAAKIEEEAEAAETVGLGGSVTLQELGFPERLAGKGVTVLLGAPHLSPEERLAVLRRQLTCDLFLSGINAVTLDGKIVNVDATGNRIGAMTFGPRKVVVVAGFNKLAADVDAAIRRVKSQAAPPNARRLGRKTPCATTGFCADCSSPDRICRVVHIMERRPALADLRVILVAEPLGL